MANKDHLALLEHCCEQTHGFELWNRWRHEHESIVPDLSDADLGNANLDGVDLSGADLRGTNFEGETAADLRETKFRGANLSGSYLRGVILSGADLVGTILEAADLRGTNLNGANLSRADLTGVDLGGKNISTVNFSKANLLDAKLSHANLSGTDLFKANLSGADLRRADLSGANLIDADLSHANLDYTDLRKANLSGANLTGTDISGKDLSGSNLSRVDLSGMDLSGVDLSGMNLSGANLSKANLSGKDLTGANLAGADLSYTVLVQTNFNKVDLTGCRIYGIAAWDVKLDGTNQSDLVITRRDEPDITVDNLEVAQFVYLLLRNEKIRHVIDTITSKVVLILGRFTDKRKIVLDALKGELRRRDYIPILFDFEKPSHRNLTETVRTLAHMARFVIADITDTRSIPQELMAIVPALPSVPVQPLLQPSDDTEYAMFESLKQYPWVLPIYNYKDATEAVAEIKHKIIDPAEAKAHELMPGKTQEKTSGT